LKGKTCVITGATSGIGRAAAIQLGRLQADLILIGRDERRGAELIRRIKRSHAQGEALFLKAELAVQRNVRELAATIQSRCASVDVLINNAGAWFHSFRTSPDNIELTFATNHLSHFLLTILLLEKLLAAKAARVITVSSGTHKIASDDFERNLHPETYDRMAAYGSSKLANLMFAYELARRLRGTGITSNAMNPGAVASNWGRNEGYMRWMRHIGPLALTGNLVSPRKGAETMMYLATSPEVEGISGKYFFRNKVVESSRISHNGDAAKRLWELSLRLTGLNEWIDPLRDLIKL
jgi:NAD(P)-dependent dehydrogenase (short-subunit alcohol dehydrogenase family)